MAATVDQLIELIPESDPPSGFDIRVLSMIKQAGNRSAPGLRSEQRRAPVAAVLLVGAILAGGGWLFGEMAEEPAHPAILPASHLSMRSAADMMVAPLLSGGREVGETYIDPRNPSWLFISVFDDGSPGATQAAHTGVATIVTCEVVRRDGSTISVGNFALRDGHAGWATNSIVDPNTVEGTRLTTSDGATFASGTFPPRAPRGNPPESKIATDQGKNDSSTKDSHKDKGGQAGKPHDKDRSGKAENRSRKSSISKPHRKSNSGRNSHSENTHHQKVKPSSLTSHSHPQRHEKSLSHAVQSKSVHVSKRIKSIG
jgi:hypothetical protein